MAIEVKSHKWSIIQSERLRGWGNEGFGVMQECYVRNRVVCSVPGNIKYVMCYITLYIKSTVFIILVFNPKSRRKTNVQPN